MNLLRALTAALAVALLAMAALAAGPQYRLRVDGLACPFCAYGIEKQLRAVEGVASAETNIGAGVVLVTMEEGATLDEARARRAVEDAGFSFRALERVEQGE